MKAVGLITEYNPLHNGHIYHLQESVKLSQADVSIVVMSGNYVQRGEPAVIDKYARCAAAIDSGVNLVLELPAYYALSSAEGFASGAVRTLEAIHADSVVFGSESGNLPLLEEVAAILNKEPEEYRLLLKSELSKGSSFPLARQTAMISYLKQIGHDTFSEEEIEHVLSSPNNILGIEYIKAIRKNEFRLKPLTITRKGTGYNETEIKGNVPSATAIRSGIGNSKEQFLSEIQSMIPASMYQKFNEQYGLATPIVADDFSLILRYRLEQIFYSCNYEKVSISHELSSYLDISTDLGNRIVECFDPSMNFTDLALKIKTKQYTYSRISRCLFHIILDMKKVNNSKYIADQVPYIRVLGFDEFGQKYLGHIKKKCEVPLIVKTADNKDLLQDDIYITNIYNQVVFQKFHTMPVDEYRRGIYMKKNKQH